VEIERTIAELNENYHTSIEDVFKPYLDSLLAGTLSFLEGPAKASMFYSVQYLRTNHIKKHQACYASFERRLLLKLANVLVHILGKNLGFNMYARRGQYTIILLDTRVRFHSSRLTSR